MAHRRQWSSGAACGQHRNYRPQAKLMQQQQNYQHSVDSGDYFLIEMMTNLPSLATGSSGKKEKDGNKWFERRRGEGRQKPGNQRKWLEASTLPPRWPPCCHQPADRAVSHTQVMAGQPSLAIVPHSHFITIPLLQQVHSKNLWAWFDNIRFFSLKNLELNSWSLKEEK